MPIDRSKKKGVGERAGIFVRGERRGGGETANAQQIDIKKGGVVLMDLSEGGRKLFSTN